MKTGGFARTRRSFVKDLVAGGLLAGAPPALRAISALPADSVQPGAADWPRFGYDLHNTRFNAREKQLGRNNVDALKLRWTVETSAPIQTTPTVIGNTLYFGTLDGYQYALDSATGQVKWKQFMGYDADRGSALQGVRSSSQYVNGRLYFGTGLAKVHCLDAQTGKEYWQTQLDDDPMQNRAQVFCSVNVHQGKVYVGTSSGQAKVACLDARTGIVLWQFHVVADPSRGGGGSIWTSPAIDAEANIVYFGTGSVRGFMPADPMLFTESMLACDTGTGEILWYDQLRAADPFDLDFSCHPMIFQAQHPSRPQEVRPCVGAGSKAGFYCFNRYSGKRLWKAMLTHGGAEGGPELNSTATAYNRVFVVSNATGIRGRQAQSLVAAVHAYTGDVIWSAVNPATIMGPVAVANEVFYQGLTDGTLEAIDAFTGEPLWQHRLPGMIRGGMAIANGHLYTSTGDSVGWRTYKAVEGKSYGLYAFGL